MLSGLEPVAGKIHAFRVRASVGHLQQCGTPIYTPTMTMEYRPLEKVGCPRQKSASEPRAKEWM